MSKIQPRSSRNSGVAKKGCFAPSASEAALDARVCLASRSVGPSTERGSMAGKRHQQGHIYLDGQNCKGLYRRDVLTDQGTRRIRREVILGSEKNRRRNASPDAGWKILLLKSTDSTTGVRECFVATVPDREGDGLLAEENCCSKVLSAKVPKRLTGAYSSCSSGID
jgi:hypothetical protein